MTSPDNAATSRPTERSSPGNERRPGGKSGAVGSRSATGTSVTHDPDITSRDVLVAEIVSLGADGLYAASLGWRLGRLDAEEIVKERVAQAGRDVACSPDWRAIRRRPTHAELQRRRSA